MNVKDVRPSNLAVRDPKPSNNQVEDPKPQNGQGFSGEDRVYTQVLTQGMYMGIPPFTYPEAGTVESPFSP